ncbi:MAG: aspartate--tRNA ligase, partial [Candidatus Methanomethylophilaceae archaeon]
EELLRTMHTFSRESVISVHGLVRERVPGTEDPRNVTGQVEVLITDAELLNASRSPPFELGDQKDFLLPGEDMRLRYRYLDLRRTEMIAALRFRHRFVSLARRYLEECGFVEVETPMLCRSTPEGARDFLVPSRVHPGSFYALPQSPQLFKQMLMVGGLDRYYQLARCFRDEDSRADRQPEFTQLDLEMSFVDRQDVIAIIEGMMAYIWEGLYGLKLQTPFPHISFTEAMSRYGTDKPDLRFGLPLVEVTEIVRDAPYEIFQRILSKNGVIIGVNVKADLAGSDGIGRNEIDRLIAWAKKQGMGGMTWMRATTDGLDSNIVKYFTPEVISSLRQSMQAEEGDLLLFLAGPKRRVLEAGGLLRQKLAEDLELIPEGSFHFLWLVDCPMFEKDEVTGRLDAFHHPFVRPCGDLDSPDLGGESYDLVLNGVELGSGSLRNHDPEVQRRIFQLLGMSEEKMEEDFGFFLEALSYGAPPHGGIALGVDRMVSILLGKESIREVIAFPKNKKAQSLVDGSPRKVEDEKLSELQIMSVAFDDLDLDDLEDIE